MIDKLDQILRALEQRIHANLNHTYLNLLRDRDIEWSWVASQMPTGPREALDFGCGSSYLALIGARRGFNVTAIDLQPIRMPCIYPRLHFVQGDIMLCLLKGARYDLVINSSSIEHAALAGRFSVMENRSEGDFEAMARIKELMKAGGLMLLTIPIGHDTVFAPLHRVYGKNRLPQLINDFQVEKEEFWIKSEANRWIRCDKDTALNFEAAWNEYKKVYGLGLFVLGKP